MSKNQKEENKENILNLENPENTKQVKISIDDFFNESDFVITVSPYLKLSFKKTLKDKQYRTHAEWEDLFKDYINKSIEE